MDWQLSTTEKINDLDTRVRLLEGGGADHINVLEDKIAELEEDNNALREGIKLIKRLPAWAEADLNSLRGTAILQKEGEDFKRVDPISLVYYNNDRERKMIQDLLRIIRTAQND